MTDRDEALRLWRHAGVGCAPEDFEQIVLNFYSLARAQPSGEPWHELFNQVASELKCLPSVFPDGNAHVLRAARNYASPPAQAIPEGWHESTAKQARMNAFWEAAQICENEGALDCATRLRLIVNQAFPEPKGGKR